MLMRDAQTGVVRDVSERYLKRFPTDYVPVETPLPTGEETPTGENKNAGGLIEGDES